MPPKKPRPDLASLLQLPQPRIAVDATRTRADLPAEAARRREIAGRNVPTAAMRAAPARGGSNRRSTVTERALDAVAGAAAPGDMSTVGGWLQEFVNPVRGAAVMAEQGADIANSLGHGRYGSAAMGGTFAAMGLVGVPGGGKAAKLPKKWAVLTAENPAGRALSTAENDALRSQWAQTLRDRGIRFRETTGAYTDRATGNALSERGFLLENVTAAEAEALGREMGQNAVLTHRGYHDLQNQVLYKSKGITPGTPSQFTEVGGARFGSDIDWSKPVPRANPEIEQMWRGMRQPDAGNFPKVDAIDEAAAQRMAKVYETLPANDPQAAEAYGALTSEVDQQFKAIQDAGYTIEFTPNDPYAGENPSMAMMKDLRENRRLRIFATPADDFHPYLTPDQNNKFRAVHDFLAHAGGGNQFGPLGEENAYRIHAQTLSPSARRALATETRGQNSWVNFGPNRELPAAQRPFATQKAALWPEEFVGDYGAMPAEQPAFEMTRPQNILTPPSSGNVFDESIAGMLRGLPEGYQVNRPKLYYPERADLSVLDGISRRVREVFNPNVERALRETPESRAWYNMQQLRDVMRNELPDGEEQFGLLMDFMGPTSVGTKVPDNIRQGSYLWQQNRLGRLRPLLDSGENLVLPEGYANRRQGTVNAGLRRILNDGGLDPIQTPKTSRYTGNLRGLIRGIPLDMHVGRQVGLPGLLTDGKGNLVPGRGFPEPSYNTTRKITSSPTTSHYATIEDMMLRHSKKMDLPPDQYMAAGWVGGAAQTGVADTRTPIQIFNQKFRDTAQRQGGTPLEALQRFLAGLDPLW